MTEYTVRCIKLDTYRDIAKFVNARNELIKNNRTSTREIGMIYDYEDMIDEAVTFLGFLKITYNYNCQLRHVVLGGRYQTNAWRSLLNEGRYD